MTGSIWTDVLLFVAFITLLSVGMFRLDTILSTPRQRQQKRAAARFSGGMDESGRMVLRDPDGRASRRRVRK